MAWSAATATASTSGLNFCLVGSALRTIPATLVFTDALHASQFESRKWPRCSCRQPSEMEPRAGLIVATVYNTGDAHLYAISCWFDCPARILLLITDLLVSASQHTTEALWVRYIIGPSY